MNAQRRKAIQAVITKIEELSGTIEEIVEDLRNIAEEEEESLNNLPEILQESERGEAMQENINSLEEASSNLEEIDLEEITSMLEDIISR